MDDNRDLSARFRLPERLAESGDPVDGNPYSTDEPEHQVWRDATRKAEAELCRIKAEAPFLDPANADQWLQIQAVARLDIWANRGLQVIWSDDAVRRFDRWLLNYANSLIEFVAGLLAAHPPPIPPERILHDLRRRLGARVQHWKGEARRGRVQQEEDGVVPHEIRPRRGGEMVTRRRRAIQKYRDDHNLDAIGFARKVGISDTAVRAIIREDWNRFNRVTQDRLLSVIGMTREAWYEE